MSRRNSLLKSIAGTMADYRAGEIDMPTPEHVEMWIDQFDGQVQVPMLEELDHVLKQTYIPKNFVEQFLSSLVTNQKLVDGDPYAFWANVKLLDIQNRGNSQYDMLQMFDSVLRREFGLGIDGCGEDSETYLYLDDAIFTGNRISNDLSAWIQSNAPRKAIVHIITIGFHRGGQGYASEKIQKAATAEGKNIKTIWWRSIEIEDRKSRTNSSDVLRPTRIPDDELTQEYVNAMTYPPVLRKPGGVGGNRFYSSEEGRHLLEQELLKAGVRIRSMCPYLNVYQRPLGNMVLETLGFGSLLVTFRNCPNNCPLAFWAGDPWYPLFPRKTN